MRVTSRETRFVLRHGAVMRRGGLVRRLALALGLAGAATAANAEDWSTPTLRGSSAFVPGPVISSTWSGVYVGGHFGYSSARVDFSGATSSLVEFILRNTTLEDQVAPSEWDVLGAVSVSAPVYGAFIGFNSQWEAAILGLEASYNRTSFNAVAPVTPITRVNTVDNTTYTTTVTGAASLKASDYFNFRARAGWVAGSWMPYATVGAVVGFADYARSATVFGTYTVQNDDGTTSGPFAFGPWTESESKKNALVYGWSAGLGVDYSLFGSLFLRGEFEYIRFGPIAGIAYGVSNGRMGIGLKF